MSATTILTRIARAASGASSDDVETSLTTEGMTCVSCVGRLTEEDWQRMLGDPAVVVLVAYLDDQPVGRVNGIRQLNVWIGDDIFAMDDLCVRAEARDRGIGGRLMAALAEHVSECGLLVTRGVGEDNDAGHRFYRRLGATLRTRLSRAGAPPTTGPTSMRAPDPRDSSAAPAEFVREMVTSTGVTRTVMSLTDRAVRAGARLHWSPIAHDASRHAACSRRHMSLRQEETTMMRGTPRTFVGPTVFTLDGAVCVHVAEAVRSRTSAMPGISACELDIPARVLVVTAEAPVDRSAVLEVLRSTGCPIRA